MVLLFWSAAIFLAGYNLGLGGVLIVIGAIFINDSIIIMNRQKAQAQREYIRENNVIVRIDVAQHNGEDIYLAYAPANNKFIVQSMSYDDLKNELIKKYEGKSIFVKSGDNDITPIYLTPTSNYTNT